MVAENSQTPSQEGLTGLFNRLRGGKSKILDLRLLALFLHRVEVRADAPQIGFAQIIGVGQQLTFALKPLKKRHAFVGKTQRRKSTRLNSSHVRSSYAVFCLKKKKK